DHKRKHDSDDEEDDDDDEGPSAGSNQGKSAKRRRLDSGASGSAQPPTKYDEQSSKKPGKSDASASKQHPALPSTGWKITDTKDADVDSSMHRSDPESEQSEQSSDNIPDLMLTYPGSNQGKSTKRRRHDSGASGSAQPPKDDEKSMKTKQDTDASASR
ncbi:hypothetical protein Tco_0191977, partial [Tanacetum coccineum]